MKKNTGARWEITVDGKPRTYDHKRELAIEAAQYLKRKNPHADVTVRDLEGIEATIIIPAQQPRVRPVTRHRQWRPVQKTDLDSTL
jgi:hypothetical protein